MAEAPETLEAAEEPLVGPQDEIERIELAEDQELDEDIEDWSAPIVGRMGEDAEPPADGMERIFLAGDIT